MKNKRENDYLIHRILEKIEGSSVDWRKEASGNRSLKIQQEDFNRAGKRNFWRKPGNWNSVD